MTRDTRTEAQATAPAAQCGLPGFLSRNPLLIDITVAVLYVALLLPGLLHSFLFDGDARNAGISVAATIGAGIALIFRRRAPLAVLAVVVILLLGVKTLMLGFTDPIGIAIAGYAIGAYMPPRPASLAVSAAIAVVVLAIVIGAPLLSTATPVDALLILTLVVFVPACLIGLLVNILSKLREAEELRVLHDLQEQAHAAELTELQLRAVLSREMHDVVGHSLTAIINLSDGALRASTASPDVLEAGLRRINSIARDALGETRTILGTLRPDGEPAPRTPARANAPISAPVPPRGADCGIHELLDTAASTGLVTSLHVVGEPRPEAITDETSSAVYRIVQEAITNVMRHAMNATHLSVTLTYGADELTVQVHDDGESSADAVVGSGLRGASERAAGLGGVLHCGPAAAGGWHVTATLPTGVGGTS